MVWFFLRPYLILSRHRYLIWQLTKREVVGRYRGSFLGLFWSLIYPLVMLMIYTVVFGMIFPAKWPLLDENAQTGAFAVVLFCGLIPHAFFSEALVRSPGLIVGNPSYVKKFVFPIEVLPWVTVLAGIFHLLAAYLMLLIFYVLVFNEFHVGLLVAPVVVLPLMVLAVGVSWILAAVGVYLRDIGQIINMVVTALLFLSPIFFPLEVVDEPLRGLMYFNPLTLVVDQFRALVMVGTLTAVRELAIYLGISIVVAALGLALFQKARRGFGDVI